MIESFEVHKTRVILKCLFKLKRFIKCHLSEILPNLQILHCEESAHFILMTFLGKFPTEDFLKTNQQNWVNFFLTLSRFKNETKVG